MKLIIRPTAEEMGMVAAQIVLGTMYQDKRVNLSITAGSSPESTYQILSTIVHNHSQDFDNVHYYNFDNMAHEHYPSGITLHELHKQYLEPANVAAENVHILTADNYEAFVSELESNGGLDLMLIGLGGDGHFCGNMPGSTRFDQESYLVEFRSKHADNPWVKQIFGDSILPEYGVTLGAAALMKAKRLLLIVNGKSKAETVKKMMDSRVDEAFPASILKLHPNFTIVLDEDAASLL